MAADGSVNLNSTSVGFVAFVRNGVGNKTVMFKKYEELCRQPTADAARHLLGLDPGSTHSRFVSTTDDGITQLGAVISGDSFDDKLSRNEVHVKLSKNRTAVFQPCDTGKGHRGMRQQTQKLSLLAWSTLTNAFVL